MVRNRHIPKRIRDNEPKRRAIRAAVSMKNPSGTMLISISVDGSKIHRSLVKKIWWNMMKYLEKSVDMISPRAVIRPKNRPVPMQREGGRTFLIRAFVAAMNARSRTVSTRQTVRMDMAFRKSTCTSSIWAISRS